MKTELVTAADQFPLSLEDAKAHLNVTTSDFDEDIQSMVIDAIRIAENDTCRALLTQTWKGYLDSFPSVNNIRLPFGQLQDVSSITYKDSDGTETTLDTSDYIVETTEPGRIVLAYNACWPSFTAYPSNPICITFVCGWDDPADVPAGIVRGIKLLIADFWENRGTYVFGNTKKTDAADTLFFKEAFHGVWP